ncbi:MAG: T9SS type A sorting domain-containing protein [Bacteroidetes bacterium]|jgi:endonuclease/exonuclease/phosphatase family metal-dependent hydrolase|nr:T9SS type A sorting domain-containing protein [Bacteroidota bacterium]MBT6686174.1 T9SS type A sorting domain-containing protein [Bacteroidota bacterium]MBT7143885.1 T9SS type A sorting domain-containing protein [Bacteroidota bacterium]MBT7491240.1 T9SS type A sorting domain-containing protein [Bacteroidota bacterium]
MKINKTIRLLVLVTFSFNLSAQTIDDLNFGTDSTLEIVSWNIEWFPKNGQTTIDYVRHIIEALDVDILALQEINEETEFNQLVDNLTGYDGHFENSEYSGLAYIYKPDKIEVLSIHEILFTSEYWRPFPRPPLIMEINYSGENFILINNHLKCCGDEILDLTDPWDEETRRFDACNLLKQYIDYYFEHDNVILLGDLNDEIAESQENNVFQALIDDTTNYFFADMEIAQGNISEWSYPSWPSHIDHILISNELFDEFNNEYSDIQTIKVDDFLAGGFSEYDSYISDHRPVGLKLKTNSNVGFNNLVSHEEKFINYPNPFKTSTKILFSPAIENAEIEIYNFANQKIADFEIAKNQSSVVWNAKNFQNGIYFAKLIVNEEATQVRKMILLK